MAISDSLRGTYRKLLAAMKVTTPNWVEVLYPTPSLCIKIKASAGNKSIRKRQRQWLKCTRAMYSSPTPMIKTPETGNTLLKHKHKRAHFSFPSWCATVLAGKPSRRHGSSFTLSTDQDLPRRKYAPELNNGENKNAKHRHHFYVLTRYWNNILSILYGLNENIKSNFITLSFCKVVRKF